jgi:hypothetical protein
LRLINRYISVYRPHIEGREGKGTKTHTSAKYKLESRSPATESKKPKKKPLIKITVKNKNTFKNTNQSSLRESHQQQQYSSELLPYCTVPYL